MNKILLIILFSSCHLPETEQYICAYGHYDTTIVRKRIALRWQNVPVATWICDSSYINTAK